MSEEPLLNPRPMQRSTMGAGSNPTESTRYDSTQLPAPTQVHAMNPRQLRTRAHILQLDAQHLAITLQTVTIPTPPDGYPTTTQPAQGNPELTPTENAAHQRLGDLQAAGNQTYRPGPITKLADLAELIAGANDLIRRAHAIAATLTTHTTVNYDHLRCTTPHCNQWADPRRRDGQLHRLRPPHRHRSTTPTTTRCPADTTPSMGYTNRLDPIRYVITCQ